MVQFVPFLWHLPAIIHNKWRQYWMYSPGIGRTCHEFIRDSEIRELHSKIQWCWVCLCFYIMWSWSIKCGVGLFLFMRYVRATTRSYLGDGWDRGVLSATPMYHSLAAIYSWATFICLISWTRQYDIRGIHQREWWYYLVILGTRRTDELEKLTYIPINGNHVILMQYWILILVKLTSNYLYWFLFGWHKARAAVIKKKRECSDQIWTLVGLIFSLFTPCWRSAVACRVDFSIVELSPFKSNRSYFVPHSLNWSIHNSQFDQNCFDNLMAFLIGALLMICPF